jgi:hypothetical protein
MNSSLNNSVISVLEQGLNLLDVLSDELYARSLSGTFGGILGGHYRHVLDHFLCLLQGVRTGCVNYDQRRRSPVLETSLMEARRVTEALMEEFNKLSREDLQSECLVSYRVSYGEDREEAVISNVTREVMFCVGHAIHHYAILRLLCVEMDVDLPYEFGIAPSTLKYLEAAGRA